MRNSGKKNNKINCKFKEGQLVMFKHGDPNLYEIHTIYSTRKVSLGLKDFPDVEQDNQVSTGEIRLATVKDLLNELDKEDEGRYFETDYGCEGVSDECCGCCGGTIFHREQFVADMKRINKQLN